VNESTDAGAGSADAGVCSAESPGGTAIGWTPEYGDSDNSECCVLLENGNVIGWYLSPD
jgi:hypothetical protein